MEKPCLDTRCAARSYFAPTPRWFVSLRARKNCFNGKRDFDNDAAKCCYPPDFRYRDHYVGDVRIPTCEATACLPSRSSCVTMELKASLQVQALFLLLVHLWQRSESSQSIKAMALAHNKTLEREILVGWLRLPRTEANEPATGLGSRESAGDLIPSKRHELLEHRTQVNWKTFAIDVIFFIGLAHELPSRPKKIFLNAF